jgi:hypothetical protein
VGSSGDDGAVEAKKGIARKIYDAASWYKAT